MNLRYWAVAVVVLAGYLVFGDFIQASLLSTPESFVASVGRGIGGAVSGIASTFTGLFWG